MARVLGLIERRVEQGVDGVADDFVDQSAMVDDQLDQAVEVRVEKFDQLMRLGAIRQGGEAFDVGKQGGDIRTSPFSFEDCGSATIWRTTAGDRCCSKRCRMAVARRARVGCVQQGRLR